MRRSLALALGTVAALLMLCFVSAVAGAPALDVNFGTSETEGQLRSTVPIGRSAGAKARAVLSLGPAELGDLRDGDRLRAEAEVEITLCLGGEPSRKCIGHRYTYDPHVRAQTVLTRSRDGTNGVVIGRDVLQCSQHHPNSNHHCVLVVPASLQNIPDAQDLPCPAGNCFVNLVVSASHTNARRGDQIVIGSDDGRGHITTGKNRLDAFRFRGGAEPSPRTKRKRQRSSIPIAANNGAERKVVIRSIRLPEIHAGDTLRAAARSTARIAPYRYSTLVQTGMVLAHRPDSTEGRLWVSNLTPQHAELGMDTGFNCTQGHSAHPDPCLIKKVAGVRFDQGTQRPVYLNLVASMRAIYLHEYWRSGDHARMPRQGYMKIWYYRGA